MNWVFPVAGVVAFVVGNILWAIYYTTPRFAVVWPVEHLPATESEKEFARFLRVDHNKKQFYIASTDHFRVAHYDPEERDVGPIRSAVLLPRLNIDAVTALHVRHWDPGATTRCKTKTGTWVKCRMDGVPMVSMILRDHKPYPEPHIEIYARNGWSADELLDRISHELFHAKKKEEA
jgi:hypothetical protein